MKPRHLPACAAPFGTARGLVLRRPLRLGNVVAAAIAVSCQGCPDDKPYTPYTLGSGSPSGSAAAPTASAVASRAPGFVAVEATGPEGDGSSFALGDGPRVRAPAGRRFALALARDVDRDGAPDLLAWAVPAER